MNRSTSGRVPKARMGRHQHALAAVALGAALLATAAGPAAAQPNARGSARPTPQQIERARTLFTEGSAHYEAGRLHEALEAFLGSWQTVRNPLLAYNVARTYERLGDADNGIRFYGYYLRNGRPTAEERAETERRIADLEQMRQRQRDQLRSLPPSSDQLAEEARTFFNRGVTMYRRRQYEAALAAFTAAYNFTRPNPPAEVLYNLAMTAEQVGQLQDAIGYYREYARTLPRDGAERRQINAHVAELRERR